MSTFDDDKNTQQNDKIFVHHIIKKAICLTTKNANYVMTNTHHVLIKAYQILIFAYHIMILV